MRKTIARIAHKYGVSAERLELDEAVGTSRIFAAAHQGLSRIDPTGKTTERFDRECYALLTAIDIEAVPRSKPRPGVLQLLAAFERSGRKLAVFTRSSLEFTRAVLQACAIARYFSHVRTRDAPGPTKPSPEALDLLLMEMDLNARQVAYVGDHPEDAQCALERQVAFYGVLPDPSGTRDFTAEQFWSLGASGVVQGLTELIRIMEPGPE
jgi:phosphoglycolate phosphatase-like HAD superfamily hydrolase